ncbi:leucine-rich repeat domain-containing protein [Viscerimonas tarda]
MKFKKLLSAVVCFLATTIACAQSGTCGENLTWTFDSTTGTLTISGTGAMTDYSDNSHAPWFFSFRSSITNVDIQDGVTSIGVWAFVDCSNLTSVSVSRSVTSISTAAFPYCSGLTSTSVAKENSVYTDEDGVLFDKAKETLINYPEGKLGDYIIPNSVKTIARGAFGYCRKLTSVIIPNSVTSIEDWAFSYCGGLISITIPNSVESIGSQAFYYCSKLTDIYVQNTTPPTCVSPAFDLSYSPTVLHVPSGAKEAYQSADVWKEFKIVDDVTGIDPISADDLILSTQYYDLQGKTISQPQQGAVYIVKELHQSGKTTVKKIIP